MRKQWGKDWDQGEEKNRAERAVEGEEDPPDGVTDKGRKEGGRTRNAENSSGGREERKGKGTR